MQLLKVLWIGVLLFSLQGNAQSGSEKQVAAAVEKLRKAMLDPDKATLESLVAEKLSYGHSSGALDDKAIFMDKLLSGKSDFTQLSFEDQTIAISGDAAIVRHTLKGKTNDGGRPGDVNIKVLLVWQKTKGKWLLLARQAVRI